MMRSIHALRSTFVFSSGLRRLRTTCLLASLVAFVAPMAFGQTMKAPDIHKTPTLYVVPYAHLDTQFRWEFPQTISEYLLKTMRMNFDYIEKYPHYVFNWTGSNRYRLMKEYYPSDYARIEKYVAEGRWFPAGSSVEEGDVNLPSAEGIFRQILYGNEYFRKDFGKASTEFMLPDCFGFPASLPSILAHAGLKGFSTQKLNSQWRPAAQAGGPDSPEKTPEGIPFNVGMWIGPDGNGVLAALNPNRYGSRIRTDLSVDPHSVPVTSWTPEQRAKFTSQEIGKALRFQEQNWATRIDLNGKVTGVYADYHYVGVGDTGGAIDETTAQLLEAIVSKSIATLPPVEHFPGESTTPLPGADGKPVRLGEGPVHVIAATAEQMFNDIKPEMTSRMPRYEGDIELINHTAGSLTSQAYHKRWVIKNEFLADKAEKTSVAAAWLGARTYPQTRLNDAWTLELSGHFHDTGAGTATPRAFQFAWNDDLIAANQFSDVFVDATEAISSGLDTRTRGTAIVVYNSLNIEREDIVEASLNFPGGAPKTVRVSGPDGKEVPAQIEGGKVLFLARVPSVGYAVYSVEPSKSSAEASTLKVSTSSLENARYRVRLDQNGDVASIYDKTLHKELLSAPIRLAISYDAPKEDPAWNMDFDQVQAAPRAYVSGNPHIRIKENGPARVSLEIVRETEGSKFVQTVSLSAGDAGNRVDFHNSIDWRGLSSNLKAVFPFSASNPDATYNWDIGTIQRPNESPRQFEVASHDWIDLTDRSGNFGVTVLTDCKRASDKPSDNTLRLTLLRSPGMRIPPHQSFSDQANQEWGHHEIVFGIAGHQGDWHQGQTEWQAYRLSDPLAAFQAASHAGALGKDFSFAHLNNSRIRMLALKKAESGDETIVRMVELDGRPAADVRISFASPVVAAREVNAQEQPVGPATIHDGVLTTSFTAYQPRTFALRLAAPPAKMNPGHSQPVTLAYDLAVASNDDTKTVGGGFDGKGSAIPAEMLPSRINYRNVQFDLEPARTGVPNAIAAKGQTIQLPPGHYSSVYILAASANGDQKAVFRVGRKAVTLNIQDWSGFIGQWDTRLWKDQPQRNWAFSANHAVWPPDPRRREKRSPGPNYPQDYLGLTAGYIKPASLAWYASHHHTADGLNEPYQYSYLFAYPIDLIGDERTLTLPNNDTIRVLAVSVAEESPRVTPTQPLFDTLNRIEPPSPSTGLQP